MLQQSGESYRFLFSCVFSSTENGEKTEKAEKEEKAEKVEKVEPEPEVKEEEPEELEEMTVKTKAKKDKKPAEEGFELWNELEVQRIKFMVSGSLSLLTQFDLFAKPFLNVRIRQLNVAFILCWGYTHVFISPASRTTFLVTSTTFGSWPCSSPLLSISSCSSTRSVHLNFDDTCSINSERSCKI